MNEILDAELLVYCSCHHWQSCLRNLSEAGVAKVHQLSQID